MDDPFRIFDNIRQAYLRYLDSPFRLRYAALMGERRRLLDQDLQLYRNPLFEPVSAYEPSGKTVAAACADLGVDAPVADFLTRGLFKPADILYQHQYDALKHSRDGRAVVVTTGTSSGKTECYLLPLFVSLLEESGRPTWKRPGAPAPLWWRIRRQERIHQRAHERDRRPAALRALLLYPLNALIEDQLGRIRKACDGKDARDWLQAHRPGHRLWFGRYTSLTPVSGLETHRNGKPNTRKRQELRRRLVEMDREWTRAQASARHQKDDRILSYFQDPRGSEMWSRWDMQSDPPDVLITNFSMLNIMLMRSVEDDIFTATKRWLADDRENNVFHLIVDELHSYRGTPGTEVGYLLRTFLHRIGITPDSPQLRILATSASIEESNEESRKSSLDYLEQFFGRDRASFVILAGKRLEFSPPAGGRLAPEPFATYHDSLQTADAGAAASALATAAGCPGPHPSTEEALCQALASLHAIEPVRIAAAAAPFTESALAASAFGGNGDLHQHAARGILQALVRARKDDGLAPLPLRVHYFFHNAGRLWACVNPECPGRPTDSAEGSLPPPVGKLFTEPQPRCDACRSRVLELLYCQPCGEVFIGGYKREDPGSKNGWHLSPDFPNLDRVPDKSVAIERSFGEFLVFWPSQGRPLFHRSPANSNRWQWQERGEVGYQWKPAQLDHTEGRLSVRTGTAEGATSGYVFLAPNDDANACASKCPHCGADWLGWRGVNSPIRSLGSGFQRIVQLLCDALLREMPAGSSRKLVLFTDSRQDAAKLSTGIKLDHYRDTIRQIAFRRLFRAAGEGFPATTPRCNATSMRSNCSGSSGSGRQGKRSAMGRELAGLSCCGRCPERRRARWPSSRRVSAMSRRS
jgi:hypothetical protein